MTTTTKTRSTTNSTLDSTTTTPCSPTRVAEALSVQPPPTTLASILAPLAAPRRYSLRLTLPSAISATDALTGLNRDGNTFLIDVVRSMADDAHNFRSVTHSVGMVQGLTWWQSCCRRSMTFDEVNMQEYSSCFFCLVCRGCIACKDNMITGDTLFMGQWVTAKREKLWPYQMDDRHLGNAIRKLHRDKAQFKKDWKPWAAVLEAEAELRGLDW